MKVFSFASETRSQQAFCFAEQARADEDEQGRTQRPQRAREQRKKLVYYVALRYVPFFVK